MKLFENNKLEFALVWFQSKLFTGMFSPSAMLTLPVSILTKNAPAPSFSSL